MFGQLSLPDWIVELVSAFNQVVAELFWFLVGYRIIYAIAGCSSSRS
jgi:hypothetical protein